MRVGRKLSSHDLRYQKTEKLLLKRVLSVLRRRGGHISTWEVCTGKKRGEFRKKLDKRSLKKGEKEFCAQGTFYNHYRNIDDAIEQMEARLVQEFAERLERLRATGMEMSAEQILAELLRFVRQNKQAFIVTAECWRLGTYEEIFKLIYPYVSQGFPRYSGAAVQEQLFWLYLGQVLAILVAWVRQTDCDIEEEKACLRKLLIVQRKMGIYLREVGVVAYKNPKVEEADLPRNVREMAGRYKGSFSGAGGYDSGAGAWWKKDGVLKHGREEIDKRQRGREQGGRRN